MIIKHLEKSPLNDKGKSSMTLSNTPAYQPHLSPNIPQVINNKDYQEFRSGLEQIDAILVNGKVEKEFVDLCLEHKQNEVAQLIEEQESETSEAKGGSSRKLSRQWMNRLQKTARKALPMQYRPETARRQFPRL